MTLGDSHDLDPEPRGVGGWLGFLCFSLFVTPLASLADIASSLQQFDSALGKLFVIALDGGIAGFAIFVAVALIKIRHYAVRAAKLFFFFNLALGLLGSLTIFDPNFRPLDIFNAIRTLAVSAAWLAYLYRSKRVHDTYAPAAREKISDVFA